MAAQDENTFEGIWYCGYWYPSNQHEGEDLSEYYARAYQKGNTLTIESLPTEKGDYILLRLVVDGDLATGVWEESTAPEGEFAGAIYSGAVQMLISKNNKRMEGKWVGVGQDDGKRGIYSGRWEMHRAGANEARKLEQAQKSM